MIKFVENDAEPNRIFFGVLLHVILNIFDRHPLPRLDFICIDLRLAIVMTSLQEMNDLDLAN